MKAINQDKGSIEVKALLDPLEAIMQGKFVKAFPVAMNCLQKILQQFVLTSDQIVKTLTMLKFLTNEQVDEMTQIRVLQIILTFLDPRNESVVIDKEFANLVLTCCFQLFDSKSKPVQSSIQATLRQLFSIIIEKFQSLIKRVFKGQTFFDKLGDKRGQLLLQDLEIEQIQGLFDKEIQKDNAYIVLHDLIQNLSYTLIQLEQAKKQAIQQAPIWNLKVSSAAKCAILDLLNECIAQAGDFIKYSGQTLDVFSHQIVPAIDQMLQQKVPQSSLGQRQLKCAVMMIDKLQVGIHLMTHILGETDIFSTKSRDGSYTFKQLNWRGAVAFECLGVILSNPGLCQLFAQTTLTIGVPILGQVLETIEKTCRAIEINLNMVEKSNSKEDRQKAAHLLPGFFAPARASRLLHQPLAIDQELHNPSLGQVHRLLIEVSCALPGNFGIMLDSQNVRLGLTQLEQDQFRKLVSRSVVSGEKEDSQTSRLKSLLTICSSKLQETLQKLLSTCQDSTSIALILRAYQNSIGSYGSMRLFEERDSFIKSLCTHCTTLKRDDFSEGNIMACKTLLSIAHKYGKVLDVKSWYAILETLQRVDKVIAQKLQYLAGSLEKFQNRPSFDKAGNQTLINFGELKSRVHEKMQEVEQQEHKTVSQPMRMTVGSSHYNRNLSIAQAQEDPKKLLHKRQQSMFEDETSAASGSIINTANPAVTELSQLKDSIDMLFANTLLFDGQTLSLMTCALSQLAVGVLDSIKCGIGSNDIEIVSSLNLNMFAISRLVETVLVNVSRWEHFWKTLVAHFDFLAKSRVVVLRQVTIEALQLIILDIFAYKKVQKQKKKIIDNQEESKIGHESECEIVENENEKEEKIIGEITDEEEDIWSKSVWQYTLLLPLTELLKLESVQDKVLVLKSIEKVIQTCGQQIENEGWRIITVAISVQIENEGEQVVQCGFRCLKLIVSNYISMLSQQNFITLLNAIHMYGANNTVDNINNNLTAIGLFQNVADFTSQQLQSNKSAHNSPRDQDASVSSVYRSEQIWNILFTRIQSLGEDHRAEVRRTNIHTLENIVMRHGEKFGPANSEVWDSLMKQVLTLMLKIAIDKYQGGEEAVEYLASNSSQLSLTRKQPHKQKFDEASIVKALEQTDSQWEDTCCSVLQTSCRILKKYLDVTAEDDDLTLACSFWKILISLVRPFLQSTQGTVNSTEVCKSIFKSVTDLLSTQKGLKLFLTCMDDSFLMVQSATEYFEQESLRNDGSDKQRSLKLLRSALTVIETLYKIYTEDNSNLLKMSRSEAESDQMWELFQSLVTVKQCQSLFNLLRQIINISNSQEGFMATSHKLNTEERTIFDFVEYLNVVVQHKPAIQSQYLHFLLEFTELKGDSRSDAFARRTLQVLNNIIMKGQVQINPVLLDFLPNLFDRLTQLIDLRYIDDQTLAAQLTSKPQTIFFIAGLHCIHISSFLINPAAFKDRVMQPKTLTGGTGEHLKEPMDMQRDLLFSVEFQQLDAQQIRPEVYNDLELRKLAWRRVVDMLDKSLLFKMNRLSQSHPKEVAQNLVKSSQELDLQVMSFIINCLLPASTTDTIFDEENGKNREFESTLVKIIDAGCSSGQREQCADLSKYCLANLFELCRYDQEEEENLEEFGAPQPDLQKTHFASVRRKIAQTTTPVLITRCRLTLVKYAADEAKATQLSLNRAQEVNFILERLKMLDSFPDHSNQKNCKEHLIQLMPVFADMIVTSDAQIKESLRLIFHEISRALQVPQQPQVPDQNKRQSDGSSGAEKIHMI